MASVTLTEMWLHDADDPADHVTGDGFGPGGPEDEARGEMRTGSRGRRRWIGRTGRRSSYVRTFPAASPELVDWLYDHMAPTVVMVRDPRTRLFFAVYSSVEVPDRHGPVRPDVTVRFESVTYSVAV